LIAIFAIVSLASYAIIRGLRGNQTAKAAQ
jgi:hypothetical protein